MNKSSKLIIMNILMMSNLIENYFLYAFNVPRKL